MGTLKNIFEEEELRELLKTNTVKDISRLKGCCEGTVRRYVRHFGLEINKDLARQRNSEGHTKYTCDKNYFDSIDNYDKAYLLGFICADGFVTPRNEIGIGLSEKDIAMVEFFQSQLKSNKPICKKDNGGNPSAELRIQNSYLANKLISYGIIPNKSLVLNIGDVITKANVKEEHIPAFLLGYFDGDGCICKSKWKEKFVFEMNVTGTWETIEYFYNFFGQKGTITKRHKDEKNNYTIQLANNFSTIYDALSPLYAVKDNLSFFYKRKYNIFKELEDKVSLNSNV